MDSGALDALVNCLEEFDPSVKEAAAWALGSAEGGGCVLDNRIHPSRGYCLSIFSTLRFSF